MYISEVSWWIKSHIIFSVHAFDAGVMVKFKLVCSHQHIAASVLTKCIHAAQIFHITGN